MPQDRKALPEQTAHKTRASYVAGLAVSLIVGLGARWGFELGEDTTIALLIVLTPIASALATWLKRNWRIDIGATFCHPLPLVAAVGLALLLAGCAAATAVQTVAITCRTLDNSEVALLVDVAADAVGRTDRVTIARGVRQALCAKAGLTAPLAPEDAPAPVLKP